MSGLAEIEVIRSTAKMIQAFVKTEEMQRLKRKKGYDCYKEHLKKIFPSFCEDFETLFNMIIDEKDLVFLEQMLQGLEAIEGGKPRLEVEKDLGEQLATKFVYPKINRK
jgi:hypothetical protein